MLLTTKGFKKPELGDIADLRIFVGDNMDNLELELDKKSDTSHTHTDLHTHTNKNVLDATTASFTLEDESKLDGIESGAEANNISDLNATDLTDGGDSTLHYHSADRNRANHSGTQSADTIVDGTTNKVLTSTMKTNYDTAYTNNHTHSNKASLDLVSGTNTGNETITSIGTLINGATAKTTPVDADMVGLMDSAASNILKKLSWANIKATLKTYFDTLYNNYTHPTYTYTAPVDNTNTTLTSVDFISTLSQTNGHVTGGTKRNLVAGTNVSIVAEADGDVVISSTDTNTTYTASNGVTLVGNDFQHVDTSTQASVNNSGRTYIQDITLDTYGHITGITSATETVVDTNTTYDISAVTTTGGAFVRLTAGGSGSGTDDVKLASGTNVNVSYTDANTITISATDTNTTYTGSNGVLLSGTDFQHADTSTQASLTALTGANVVSDIDVDGFGHVTLLSTRALTAGDIGAATDSHNHDGDYQPLDGDLTAIAGIAGTVGLLKKTAADTWELDTTDYTTNTGTVTSIATSGAITGGTITSSGTISHSTEDGYLHVPATGTENNGKVLIAGATAGSISWGDLPASGITSISSGNGMDFTEITSTGTIALGTPSTITSISTNSTSGTTHTHEITGFSLDTHTHTDLHTHSNKLVLDKLAEDVDGKLMYDSEYVQPPNLTINELTLGGRFKLSYNAGTDSLDFGVI